MRQRGRKEGRGQTQKDYSPPSVARLATDYRAVEDLWDIITPHTRGIMGFKRHEGVMMLPDGPRPFTRPGHIALASGISSLFEYQSSYVLVGGLDNHLTYLKSDLLSPVRLALTSAGWVFRHDGRKEGGLLLGRSRA